MSLVASPFWNNFIRITSFTAVWHRCVLDSPVRACACAGAGQVRT